MTTTTALGEKKPESRQGGSWLEVWKPEDQTFWAQTGARVAWRTLVVTTLSLVLSFATWFVMSALVIRLPQVGFKFGTMQLFWLAAMPGLAGGTLRILHTFLIPILGTRTVITSATFLKLIPCIGIGLAVQYLDTPFGVFLLLAFLSGMGGGDFSSFMPSTSLFFPKRLQGTALGIQAGVGNFGVSLGQFVTPWIVGLAIVGGVVGGGQVIRKGDVVKEIWLQNAAFWYVPLLIAMGIASWVWLRSIPIRASFREQLDIFKDKHTWFCTVTYLMTFGSFSGFSAAFPMAIKSLYGGFPNAPDPLKYAFLGPLVGSSARVLFGFVADRVGGGILTQLAGFMLIGCCIALGVTGVLSPASVNQFPVFLGIMLLLFLATGIGNASTFRQFPIIFSHNPRQGAQVLGWTGAIAAYGPFVFSMLMGKAITAKSTLSFFIGAAVFYAIAVIINWYYYTRRGCERPS